MAANDYYGGHSHNSPYQPYEPYQPFQPYGGDRPSPAPYQSPPPPGGGGYTSPKPYQDDHHSQGSAASSDHDYPPAGGRRHGSTDQYADDIPLKSNAHPTAGSRPGWMDADTNYRRSPSPDLQQGGDDPLNNRTHSRRRKKKKKANRFFKKKIPWVVYLTSLVAVIVFIVELVKNAQFTGSPIMTKPSFNPMIGPSPYVQVNMGARFVPCMRNYEGIQDASKDFVVPCPWTTSNDPDAAENQCTLSELCGFGGVPNPQAGGSLDDQPEPNQWFRFIIPMFLHAGIIHIAFNLFALLTIGADMERTIGWWRFAIVYFASGIMGFVFGANFDSGGISSGASGCLFGALAICLLDLLYKWKSKDRPMMELMVMIVTIIISFVLGLLPGLDNFAHIGGFLTGLVLSICLMRSPEALRARLGTDTPYATMRPGGVDVDARTFLKRPLDFFRGRKPLWWAWWLLRVGSLVTILVLFIVLLNNFYKYRTQCEWCKYLSCLPVKNWCEIGEFNTEPVEKAN